MTASGAKCSSSAAASAAASWTRAARSRRRLRRRAALNMPKPNSSRPMTTATRKTQGLPSPSPEPLPPPLKPPPPPPPPPPKPDDPPPGAAIESTASSRPSRTVTHRLENRRKVARRRIGPDYRVIESAHAQEPHSEPPQPTETSAAAGPGPAFAAAPAQRVLALQRQIGNRAVGALIARAPKPKAPAKPKVEMTSGPYAVIPRSGRSSCSRCSWRRPLDRAAGRPGPAHGRR